jgi:hypothetical protein
MKKHRTREVAFFRTRFAGAGGVEPFENSQALSPIEEAFKRQREQPTPRNTHLAGNGLGPVKEISLHYRPFFPPICHSVNGDRAPRVRMLTR